MEKPLRVIDTSLGLWIRIVHAENNDSVSKAFGCNFSPLHTFRYTDNMLKLILRFARSINECLSTDLGSGCS